MKIHLTLERDYGPYIESCPSKEALLAHVAAVLPKLLAKDDDPRKLELRFFDLVKIEVE